MDTKNQLILTMMQEGMTSISNILLSNYPQIGLSDQEMMLIIHLLHFQSKGNHFPGISQLEQRMTLKSEEIMRLLQRLVKQKYIYIEENKDEQTGILSEAYNLTPLFLYLINWLGKNLEMDEIKKDQERLEKKEKNLYQIFEKEFGRPLSPMELESISTWMDHDRYADEIILFALREAVFANKLSFRYIDRILFEWQKKNIKTVDQIKQHIKQFRINQAQPKEEKMLDQHPFEFYNWLESEE